MKTGLEADGIFPVENKNLSIYLSTACMRITLRSSYIHVFFMNSIINYFTVLIQNSSNRDHSRQTLSDSGHMLFLLVGMLLGAASQRLCAPEVVSRLYLDT